MQKENEQKTKKRAYTQYQATANDNKVEIEMNDAKHKKKHTPKTRIFIKGKDIATKLITLWER